MRTRVKIFSSHDAEGISREVNNFLKTIDETAEIVSIATHSSAAMANGRAFNFITTTVVYREVIE